MRPRFWATFRRAPLSKPHQPVARQALATCQQLERARVGALCAHLFAACCPSAATTLWLYFIFAHAAAKLALVVTVTDRCDLHRSRHNPDSLPLFFSPDKEFDFVKDNTVLQKLLNKRKDKQDS